MVDVVSEFMSVLNPSDEPLRIALTGPEGKVIELPSGSLEERIDILLREAGPAGAERQPQVPEIALDAAPGDVWWTHNPADWRAPQAHAGLLAARLAGSRPVRHSVGHAGHSQFVVDRVRPLDGRLLTAKLDALNALSPELPPGTAKEQRIITATVPACEQFFTLSPGQAEHLHYLLYATHTDVRVPADPWGLDTSAYERARLTATCRWVREVLGGTEFTVAEPGACEGALTALLCEAGFTVKATEPHREFRRRLAERISGAAETTADTVEELAQRRHLPADAYLLAEILYYLDDFSVLDDLPTDLLLVTAPPELLESTVLPWFTGPGKGTWRLTGQRTLVGPRMDFLVDGIAYQRKRGSVGLAYRRG
ncbi:SAM-dependent methyltransferase [Streptomyces ziwulingensis]|uniref:SAM-dependent methyltransferase n=1 Tax=Streptomyces ziwulingensis TaxID=1045501 RepID=UPI0031E5B4A6